MSEDEDGRQQVLIESIIASIIGGLILLSFKSKIMHRIISRLGLFGNLRRLFCFILRIIYCRRDRHKWETITFVAGHSDDGRGSIAYFQKCRWCSESRTKTETL